MIYCEIYFLQIFMVNVANSVCHNLLYLKTMAQCNLIDNNITQVYNMYIICNSNNVIQAEAPIIDYTNLSHICVNYYCMIDLSYYHKHILETVFQEHFFL